MHGSSPILVCGVAQYFGPGYCPEILKLYVIRKKKGELKRSPTSFHSVTTITNPQKLSSQRGISRTSRSGVVLPNHTGLIRKVVVAVPNRARKRAGTDLVRTDIRAYRRNCTLSYCTGTWINRTSLGTRSSGDGCVIKLVIALDCASQNAVNQVRSQSVVRRSCGRAQISQSSAEPVCVCRRIGHFRGVDSPQ